MVQKRIVRQVSHSPELKSEPERLSALTAFASLTYFPRQLEFATITSSPYLTTDSTFKRDIQSVRLTLVC